MTVKVTDEIPLLQTENGDVSATINQQQISEVPKSRKRPHLHCTDRSWGNHEYRWDRLRRRGQFFHTGDYVGDFTIRGVTKPEKLTFTLTGRGTGTGEIKGTMAFDRKDYGMKQSGGGFSEAATRASDDNYFPCDVIAHESLNSPDRLCCD